jgi:hypothetical protein
VVVVVSCGALVVVVVPGGLVVVVVVGGLVVVVGGLVVVVVVGGLVVVVVGGLVVVVVVGGGKKKIGVVVVVVVVVGGGGKKKLGAVVVVVVPDEREVVGVVDVLDGLGVGMKGKLIVSGDVSTLGSVVGVVFLTLTVAGTTLGLTVVEVVDAGGGGSTGSGAPEVVVT